MGKILKTAVGLSPIGLILSYVSPAYAATTGWGAYLNPGDFATGSLTTLIQTIIKYLLIAGFVIAVIYLIIAGYNYITAGGNAEQATAARTAILNAIIGIVIIFASYMIIGWVFATFIK